MEIEDVINSSTKLTQKRKLALHLVSKYNVKCVCCVNSRCNTGRIANIGIESFSEHLNEMLKDNKLNLVRFSSCYRRGLTCFNISKNYLSSTISTSTITI